MASDDFELNKNIDNLRDTVKQSFSRIYASLKAQELKTLRQLEAIRKQCQDNKEFMHNCVQNIKISYENESTLLDNISRYGALDLERFNFDNSIFSLEDYISPNDDHLYSYKCIEDLTNCDNMEAIEEAALKQITKTDNCVCYVNIRREDVSRKVRDIEEPIVKPSPTLELSSSKESSHQSEIEISDIEVDQSESSEQEEVKKIEPTEEWLNSIKSQTETEPSQANDVMEHSTIACS